MKYTPRDACRHAEEGGEGVAGEGAHAP
jgi:hypothetical protein